MQRLKLSLLTLGLAMLVWSCGGNADADKFCDCFAQFENGDGDACESEMEAMESAFKADAARYEAFQKAAMKKCPAAEEYINRMN